MEREMEFEYLRVKSKNARNRRNALGPEDIVFRPANDDDSDTDEKENSAPCLRTKTKTRLERLGVLYGDGEVSSPIHKSDEHWLDDEEDEARGSKRTKDKYSEERARRFKALASTINSWEDDIRHISPKKDEPEKYDRFGNKVGSKAVRHEVVQPSGRAAHSARSPSPSRKVAWDKKIINSLEMQGFKRCESEEHLVYDYVSPESKECTSPRKTPLFSRKHPEPRQPVTGHHSPPKKGPVVDTKDTGKPMPKTFFGGTSAPRKVLDEIPLKKVVDDAYSRGILPERRVSPVRHMPAARQPSPVRQSSPVRQPSPVRQSSPVRQASPTRSVSPLRKVGSPQKSAVLEMAAQWESSSQPARPAETRKDPALLSVAEKRAVFEKNNGFIPIPQAPLTQAPVPSAVHHQRERSPVRKPASNHMPQPSAPQPSGDSPVKANVNQAVIDRFKEIEALRHRWDRNKAISAQNEEMETNYSTPTPPSKKDNVQEDTPRSIPVPPPMPHSILSPATPVTPASLVPSNAFTPSPPTPKSPKVRMGTKSPAHSPPHQRLPPRVLSIKEKSPKRDFPYPEVKRIRVSPPKQGHIYPSVSDIETESEVPESDLDAIMEEGSEEEEEAPRQNNSCGFSSELDSSFGSLGQQIVRQASKTNLKRPPSRALRTSTSSSSFSESESRILQEMDDLLDEAMSGIPSPPKKRNIDSPSSSEANFETCSTASFEYSSADGLPTTSTAPSQGGTPLVHTVSVYRKQKNQLTTPPVRREVRTGEEYEMRRDAVPSTTTPEEELVHDRIKELQIEIQKQLETVSQASKALNLCHSTPGFSGSPAELEAQRLLLVANARWNAMSQEIERLKIERKLKPGLPGRMEQGDISVRKLSLPLKSYQASSASSNANTSVLVLIKSGATVLPTEMLTIDKNTIKDGRLTFQKALTLKGLYSDFAASVEVYGYSPKKEEFLRPENSKSRTPNKKEKRGTTPKKQKDRGFLPVESPAGPQAVRSSAFQLWGFAVFSLREVNRNSFTLNKVPYTCPLEGSVEISMTSSMQSQVEHVGFLTKFEDVSGFGAWKRRWAVLRGSSIAFWAYPDQYTEGKVPMDTIDLSHVISNEAELAPNEKCARPHTILLESRIRDASIPESLVARRDGDSTIITHLLSADTKEERLQWCEQLNKVLHLLRAWKVNRSS